MYSLRRGLGGLGLVSPNPTIGALLAASAARYGVSLDLLTAVARRESAFNPSARSSAGAMGVMQLMPGTASDYGVSNPWDAAQNIDGGAHLLADLLRKYNGDLSLALAAYNAGPGNVKKYGGVPPFPETQAYVSRILADTSGGGSTFVPYGPPTPSELASRPSAFQWAEEYSDGGGFLSMLVPEFDFSGGGGSGLSDAAKLGLGVAALGLLVVVATN